MAAPFAVVGKHSLYTIIEDKFLCTVINGKRFRLRSHLEQFAGFLNTAESAGRKLEFLTQEMFRETNTIGSKSNDITIARHVIEIKASIERIREMIQNVE